VANSQYRGGMYMYRYGLFLVLPEIQRARDHDPSATFVLLLHANMQSLIKQVPSTHKEKLSQWLVAIRPFSMHVS
jgi:hypothetical protein